MKIGFLGDIHFAEYKDFSTNILVEWDDIELKYRLAHNGKKVNSRLIDIANALVEAREYYVKNDIKTVIIAGDVSHNRGAVPTIVQNVEYRVLESFKLVGINLIIIPGNHDQVSNEDFPENSLVPFQNIATIIDKPKIVIASEEKICSVPLNWDTSCLDNNTPNETQILCVPFSPNKQIVMNSINSFEPSHLFSSNIIVSHLGVSGGMTGKNSYVLTDQYDISELRYLDDNIDLVALGHYHKPQIIPGTLDKVFYTGSPVQVNFSEEGEEHGFWILDTETKKIEMHSLKSPKFITLTPENYAEYSKEDLEGNFVRIVGNIEEIASINAAIVTEENNIDTGMIRLEAQKEYAAEHRSDISTSMSYAEIVSQYAKEHEISENQLNVGLEILNAVVQNGN